MKRQLCLNRRLYEIDLREQNLYLGNKINAMKPIVNSYIPNLYGKNELAKRLSKRQST